MDLDLKRWLNQSKNSVCFQQWFLVNDQSDAQIIFYVCISIYF